jgi:DNA-binding response OmpR family regulator
MDIMMPVMDGITAMQRIRQTHNTPIILLTAKGEDIDKILDLNSGADDYVTKPFNPVELQARVKSQLRRYLQLGAGNGSGRQLVIGGIVLDDGSKSVTLDGEAISLTPTEYEILRLFMQNPGRVFSPAEIYSKVWREQPCGAEKTIAVHIRHLREKIEINPAQPRYLLVVWGQGYKIVR